MKLLKSSLLASAAGFAAVAGAQAADLPVKKAAPIEYVRVCSAYGAGFFYIPGTDTCIRLSGRARFEVGYAESNTRTGATNGDTTGYRGLARINVDARTQTAYGTLRAFTRLEFASRTGSTQGFRSGTQERIANAFTGTGQDQVGRVQQFVSTEKAFIQFAGLTAGRASSFFDFYAQDFELQGVTGGSNLASTNLIAYTSKLGASGFSATVSVEDPSFRRNTIFSPDFANGVAGAPYRVVVSSDALGTPIFNSIDVTQKNKLPDFVGVLRYDAAWGSAQISGAVKEVNTGNYNPTIAAVTGNIGTVAPGIVNRTLPTSEYGWAVQGGVKINLPFIAPGDTLYLQGAYGEGATLYTGYSQYNGSYISRGTTIQASAFDPYQSDAAIDPLTHKIQLSRSFTVVGSLLHYWSPEWRSAFFSSYGELSYGGNVRANNAIAYANTAGNVANSLFVGGLPGSTAYSLSPVLRDNYEITAGASLIWSPVKDLDIGLEGAYIKTGVTSGRVIDQTRSSGTFNTTTVAGQTAFNTALATGAIRTVKADDVVQVRMRVQRDF